MNLLAIDTSTEHSTVALALNGQIRDCLTEVQSQTQAQGLLLLIDRLLKVNQYILPSLDGLVVGKGPGSFTGIRIAASVAQGLAFAHNLPVYLVSSLKTMAYEAFLESSTYPILSLLDARMNQLYWAYYNDMTASNPEKVNFPEEIIINEPCVVTGYHYEDYLSALPIQRVESTKATYPKASVMLQWVLNHPLTPVSADKVWPMYVRNQVVS